MRTGTSPTRPRSFAARSSSGQTGRRRTSFSRSALNSEGDRNGARAEVARALEIDADLLDARRLLASIQSALGADDLAVEEGRKVLREAPDDVKIRILVAQSLVRQRKFDEALAELEKIPEAKRDAETLLRVRSDLHGDGKDWTRPGQTSRGPTPPRRTSPTS